VEFGARFIGWFDVDANDQIKYGQLAEKHSFDYCWFPHDTFMMNTWVLTSALATLTSKIKLASVGTNPYTFDPCEIATYLATLDEISHGRAVLGLGLHTTDMLGWVGINATDPVTRTREAVQLIRATLKTSPEQKPDQFIGKEFHWTDQAYLRFKPLRTEIPIHVAAYGKEFLELSGEIGDGSLPMITPPESSKYMVDAVRAGCEKARRDPKQVSIVGLPGFQFPKMSQRKRKNCSNQ